MTARTRGTTLVLCAAITCAAVTLGVVGARSALAGEEDDLQRQIETQRSGAADLERLDELKAVTDEITLLRSWLDEASRSHPSSSAPWQERKRRRHGRVTGL